jgi:hypothetical protein
MLRKDYQYNRKGSVAEISLVVSFKGLEAKTKDW